MKRIIIFGLVLLAGLSAVAQAGCQAPAQELNARISREQAERAGLEVIRCVPEIGWCTVRGRPAVVRVVALGQVEQNTEWGIPEDEEPLTTAGDPLVGQQWGLAAIRAPAAWSLSTGRRIVVAVLDTGIDTSHPDLPDTIGCLNMISGGDCLDDHGHGTHVAGIIRMTADNGIGGVGVAPAVELVSVKVLDAAGRGNMDGIAAGIVEAVRIGADVINMSLGGSEPSDMVNDALRFAVESGVLIVAACGNQGSGYCLEPAARPETVAVGAADRTTVPWWSNQYPDVIAPGVDIVSTVPNGRYATWSGTSMATPHVAGAAALYLSLRSEEPMALKDRIVGTAANDGCPVMFCGGGIVDALALLTEEPRPTPTAVRPTPYPEPTKEVTATPSPRPFPTATVDHAEPQPSLTPAPTPTEPAEQCTVTVNGMPIWEGYHWVASINAMMDRSEAILMWIDQDTYALTIKTDSLELCGAWARLWTAEGYVVNRKARAGEPTGRLTGLWIAENAVGRMHPLGDVEKVAGNPVLQIHYGSEEPQPMDLVVEIEAGDRRLRYHVTKNYPDFEDWFHLTLEMHPLCSSVDGAECRLRIRYGENVVESRLVWPARPGAP